MPINSAKRPALDSWMQFQTVKPTTAQINQWFGGSLLQTTGLAIIAGAISGSLEIVDVDVKYDLTGSLMKDFCDLLKEHLPDIFPKLVIAKTVNGGFHIIYRAPADSIQGNRKLALRLANDDEKKVGKKNRALIETRGTGGYIAAAPTDGYQWTQGSFENIPLISADEREIIMTVARSFDQMPIKESEPEQTAAKQQPTQNSTGEKSPFEDYNDRADVPALLERHGWRLHQRSGSRMIYTRPGKTDQKASANYDESRRIFYVFTTSSDFQSDKGYNPSQVFTHLEHGGDYSAAAKRLYAEGYGARYQAKNPKGDFPPITDAAAATASNEPPTEWLAPKPLDLTLKKVLKIEDDFLPKVLVNWLRPASKVIGCPFDFLVLSAVVMIGSIIGSKLRVKPLLHSDWFVVPNLYGGCVGLPSSKKTPALDETRKPILELQAAARKRYTDDKRESDIDAEFYQKEIGDLKKKCKNSSEYRNKIAYLEKPPEVSLRRFEINDVTTPKLGEILSKNANGFLQFRDELTGWMKSLEADYDLNARSFFLELWKGAIPYSIARKGDGETEIQSGTLSITGGIQPSKLLRYISEAYSHDNADGLPQRFIFAYPDAAKRSANPTEAEYHAMQNGFARVNEMCRTLADYDFGGRTVAANGDKFHLLKFSQAAQKIVDEWRGDIEAEAESLQIEDEPFSSYLYKLPKSCFAIALIFHCLEHINDGVFPDEIAEATALKAIAYTEVLTSHARRVFALGENQIFALAQTLLGKIKKCDLPQGFTAREVSRKQWSGLKTPDSIRDVLSLLIDYGYLKETGTNGEGRPTTKYFYHPTLAPEKAGGEDNE